MQEGLADPQQLPTHAHFAVIDSMSDAIAIHLPDWQHKLKAADGTEAGVLDDLLAKLQWQVLGVVRSLYCSLARSCSASSPTRKTLDVKVKLRFVNSKVNVWSWYMLTAVIACGSTYSPTITVVLQSVSVSHVLGNVFDTNSMHRQYADR